MNRFPKTLFKSFAILGTASYLSTKTPITEAFFWSSNPFNDLKSNTKLFIWGNGQYQAKPGSVPTFRNFSPKRQKLSLTKTQKEHGIPDLVDISGSKNLLVGVDSKGNLWSFKNKNITAIKKDSADSSFKKKITDSSGEQQTTIIHAQNIMSDLQNINIKGKATSVKIVLENIFVLSSNGVLYRSKLDRIQTGKPEWKEVSSVRKVKQIDGGKRHLLMLDNTGTVYAMGDDTHGQCGSGDQDRMFSGPFVHRIVRNPQKINGLEGEFVEKIFAGGNHNFVMTKSGQVYGWGFNNLMQLGHEDEYRVPDTPRLAFFAPVNFGYFFKDQTVKDIALGLDFSLFICENDKSGLTEVFGMGHNKEGQVATGFPRHVQKLTKLEPLSDFDVPDRDGNRKPLKLEISCGNKHCMARGSNNCLLIWGANQEGQLGNKKRSFTGSPLLFSKFKNMKIKNFKAFDNQCFVNVVSDK